MKIEYRGSKYTVCKDNIKENLFNVKAENEDEKNSYILTQLELNVFKRMAEQESYTMQNVSEIELVSFYNHLIKFNPFQYKPYLNLISYENTEKAIYIGDEVGAGKTFETGILISELLYSKKIKPTDSILIICPNMLCRKWQEILSRFFGLASKIVKNLNEIGNISIVSYDVFSRAQEIEVEQISDIRLLIIDEAHNVGGKRFGKIMKVRRVSEYTVLLSATPLAGKEDRGSAQVELLFGKPNNEFSFVNESCYFNRSLKDEMRNGEVKTCIKNIVVKNKALESFIEISKELYRKKNTLRKYVGLNMMMSSPAAAMVFHKRLVGLTADQVKGLLIGSTLDKNLLVELGFEDSNIDEIVLSDEDLEVLDITTNKVIEIMDGIKRIAEELDDAKLNALKILISENQNKFNSNIEDAQFYKKMVVFTNYKATADYLGKRITNAIVINGEINEDEKWRKFNEFKDEKSNRDVLIITNVACEGQDMDFCNTIVNYDLTYNPVQLAQRKGRVDRFEKNKKEIFIYNFKVENVDPSDEIVEDFILNGSLDIMGYSYSIYPVLLRKLKLINEETGIYYQVIDHVGESNNITDVNKAQTNTLEIFKRYFSNNSLADFNSIQKLYEHHAMKGKEKINHYLQMKGITIVEKNQEEIIINTEIFNSSFLKYLFDGGTINSHLIYNR